MTRFRLARVLVASVLTALFGQAVVCANEERLGEVSFPISCSPAARAQFNRAVAMQHSFFFPETVKAFTAIVEKEPMCAMAHWGVAISQRPNPLVGPFPGDVLKRGWEAIEKARASSQKTERMDRGTSGVLPGLRNCPAGPAHHQLRDGDGAVVSAVSR